MQSLPFKHIAFVFSDPASANACAAMANMVRMQGKEIACFSNRQHTCIDSYTLTEVVPDFTELGVDGIFTGTSHPESSKGFEVAAIKQAKAAGIPVYSFIDHWANFRLRFRGLEENELPDQIWVVDETARQLALVDRLPAERLIVSGNPYHYFLQYYWQPKFAGKEYLAQLGIPVEGRHLLFVPDPLSLRNGKAIAGFTEDEALAELVEVMQGTQTKLMVKCHPLQPMERLNAMQSENNAIHLVQSADTLELVHACDVVVGFYSNLLLEAEAVGKKVIRYFPGKPEADLLWHRTSLIKTETKAALATALQTYLHG
ncbi:hypothetical protein HRH25_22255 [Flavisolibacter sp. BT320]|nr:hypothetical protein [Flavisolibacter longurius]